MISIQQIQYILTLNEEKQFQRASELCFVTQPTLSMQVKKAEETLGAPIFDRSRNPLKLTAFGEELLPIFKDVISEYEKIERAVQKKEGVFREEIRMAVIPTISSYMLPDMYAKWREYLPNVQLTIEEMKTEEILIALENRKIDIGILAGPVANSKWRTIPLFQEEIKAFFPSLKKKGVKVEELMNEHPWLLTQGNCLRTQMVHFCALKSTDSQGDWDYEGGSIDLLEKMVELHGGYTIVPEFYAKGGKKGYKRITSSTGEIPAREVIALIPNKSSKWEYLETIIRRVQLKYGEKSKKNLSILSWK